MDSGCLILTFIMLWQMSLILLMLNPVYDVRKIITYINEQTSCHRNVYYMLIAFYFMCIVFLGMYVPLQNIHKMIFSPDLDDYDKLILLSKVEKNYIIAGFSLFLVVVLYGMRALLTYTANLAQIVEKTSESEVCDPENKVLNNESILPNLLRVKRSISYEAFLCTNELQDDLRAMVKNLRYHQFKNIVSRVFEMGASSQHVGF